MALKDVLKEIGYTDEETVTLMSAFDTERLQKLDSAVMRQSDYSRAQDELKKRKETLEESWQTAQAEFVKMQKDVDSTKAERDAAALKLKEAEDKLKAAPSVNLDEIRAEFTKAQRDMAAGSVAFNADALDAAEDYFEVFGKRIKPGQFMQEAIQAGKNPKDFLEEKYKISEKRAELAQKARDEEIEKARKEGYEKAISETSNPALRPLADSEVPFLVGKDDQPVWPEDNHMTPAGDKLLAELKKSAA